MNKLTDLERKLVVAFLDDLKDRMGNAVCNDYEMDDTPENRALLQAAHEYGFSGTEPFDIQHYLHSRNKLMCMDFLIVGYLAHKIANS